MRFHPPLAALLALALAAQAQMPADKAIERYKLILGRIPTEGTALDRLWKSYLDAGRTEELIAEYKTGDTFASAMILGHLLRKSGANEEAAAAYERAAALDAKNPLPLFSLAKLHTDAGRPRNAAPLLEKALALLAEDDPRKVETLLQLGAAWLAAGEVTKAAEAWEGAVTRNPGDLELRRRLADNYAGNHLAERAVPHLEYVATNAAPAERALALQQLARVHQGAGSQDAAIKALEDALALTTPGNWLRGELQSQLIRLHQRYHRVPELEERWKEFAEANPRDAGAHLQLVDLYERLGHLEEQRAWLEKLVLLLPRDPEYRLKLARLSVQMDRLGSATALFDQLLAEQPANTDFVFERARIDVQRDAVPEARARIAALLKAKANDEAVRARALEFYEQNHLLEIMEKHLQEDAVGGTDDALGALANFYFGQRREADALATLDRLATRDGTPAEQAAAQLRISQIFRTENNLPAAASALEKAAFIQPESRDIQLLLGDVQVARGEQAAAQAAFERALELSATPEQEAEADQKIFESLRAPPSRTAAPAPPPSARPALPGVEPPAPPNLALQRYLALLQGRATTQATEVAWLRLARWQAWAGEQRPAMTTAQKALELNPQSIAGHEFLVKQQITEGTLPAAVSNLHRLEEIDPANRTTYQRRAGQLELQIGRVAEAIVIFTEMTQANPGSIDVLTDLALALQRGDRWTDALEAWRRIYALSPVSKKKEAFAPLLRALERLEMHGQAAELQLKAIETEPDERAQFAQFADLLAYCTKHELLDWLRTAFERRRVARADDYFTEMALGRILKAGGNKAAAFEVLADASYAAPNQAESLPELVREAEELRKLDAAAKLQAQLVRIAPQHRPDALEKLAQLQEKNFDIEEAAQTWDRIVAKFPRNAPALQRAIDFQIKWGSQPRALELLKKLRALEPANLRTLATLAEFASEAGQTGEAAACLEAVLKLAPVEKPGEPLRVPDLKVEDAAQLQAVYQVISRQRSTPADADALAALRTFWAGAPAGAKTDRDLRLHAIRQLAQMLRARGDRPALEAWIARWREHDAAPNDALWALYYAGAGREALERMDEMLGRDPADAQLQNAFIWLAFQTRQFARLKTWIDDPQRTGVERDFLLVALGQYLAAHPRRADPGLLAELFPATSRARLWQAARVFEARGRLREAAALGQRVFDEVSSQRASYGVEIADWYLHLGEFDRARETLRGSLETTADTFQASVYAAGRAHWLLLPPAARATFTEGYLAGLEKEAPPLHRAIAGTLLHGLAGHETAARAEVERLAAFGALAQISSDSPATPAARRWAFLLSAGLRLHAWKLEPLAVALWERALADHALIELEGDQALDLARDTRRRLFALRIASAASLEEAREIIDGYDRSAATDAMVQLGEALENLGAHARAVLVYRQAWEQDSGNAQLLQSLIGACRAAQDTEAAEAVLTRVVEGGLLRANETAHHENLLQLAGMLESGGRPERARALLREAVGASPREPRLALRYAQLCERCGQPEEAVATYQRVLSSGPPNFTAQLALATLLETRGDLAGALKVLQRTITSDGEARVALLRAKNGELDEALAALDRISAPQNVWPAINVAVVLHEKGEVKTARAVLQTALDRNGDPRMRFPLQSKVVELLTPEAEKATIAREFRRLRQIADEQSELLGGYFDFAQKQAARLGASAQIQRDLSAAWAGGSGPAAAGIALLTAQLEAKEDAAAKATIDRLLAREDLGEIWLGRVVDALRTAQRPELAIPVHAALAEVNPANEEYVLDGARALHQAGRKDDAVARLGQLEALAILNDDLAARLASAYATCGEPDRARLFFQQALRADPLARNFPAHLGFAQLQMAAQDFVGAKRTLRTAFANPANTDFAALVRWLVASGRIAQADAELRDFGLTLARSAQCHRAIFAHFEKAADLPLVLAVLDAHPECLEPGLAARVRTLAQTAHDFAPAAATLEKLLAHSSDVPDVPGELARLYASWAEADLEASNPTPAIAHLQRAHQLHPAHFDIAFRLATVQADRSDRAGAIATLDTFLAASRDATETARAQTFLAQLKSGSRQ